MHTLTFRTLVAWVLVLASAANAPSVAAQTTFRACRVPDVGVIYMIGVAGAPGACLAPNHVEFSWSEGAPLGNGSVTTALLADGAVTVAKLDPSIALGGDHGGLAGLTDDDHPQYLLADGVRDATNGFAVTGTPGGGGTIPVSGAGARVMWYPNEGAFRAGYATGTEWDAANTGTFSVAFGAGNTASGAYSTAMGQGSIASGIFSTALGQLTTAGGGVSTAMGFQTSASGDYATALGQQTEAVGEAATALGFQTNALADYSTAMGQGTDAAGLYSTALGSLTYASGTASTAMGRRNTASGDYTTAMGNLTTASGAYSTAMGYSTTASGAHATATGNQTTASGNYATAMGLLTNASGNGSVAMGAFTVASGSNSISAGRSSEAVGTVSVALGTGAMAATDGSFVFGDYSTSVDIVATAANQFTVRAAGGTRFFSNSGLTAGVTLAPGAGAWATVSDRNRKRDFRDEDGESALEKIALIPIQSWSYLSQDDSIRHLGPVAQDFYEAFGLGDSDLTITTSDIDGVNMLAIQALERRTATLAEENRLLRGRLAQVERTLATSARVASPADQARADACGALSLDEIETITGTRPKVAKSTPAGVVSICSWTVDDPFPDYPLVSLTIMPQAHTSWEGFIDALIAGEMQEIVDSGERVDVGRFGLYDERMLIVATPGGSTLMLSVTPPFRPATGRDGVLALARAVLERVP